MRNVVIFEFAGRKPNVELQLPLFQRLLDENPGLRIDLWNFARDPADGEYLNTLDIDGIRVVNGAAWPWINRAWKYYTLPKFRDTVLVKIDDDVVFWETDRFAEFVEAARTHPGSIVSAQTVNNGACTRLEPGLWDGFEALDIPLLDVHEHAAYAEMSHNYMFEHWRELVDQPMELIKTEDWLSINMIAMDWPTLYNLHTQLGRRSPREIAGRTWNSSTHIGDEGAANMQQRLLMRGMLCAHLGFGPQELTEQQETLWRSHYRAINVEYLTKATELTA